MATSSKKSDGILELLKGWGQGSASPPKAAASPEAPASPKSATPVGGGGGFGTGSGGSSTQGAPAAGAEGRKRGGKYIKREWVNGAWKYTYQDDPQEGAHGFEDAYQNTHTIDALDEHHVDTNVTAEEAYNQAKNTGKHNEEGHKGTIKIPSTGQELQVRLLHRNYKDRGKVWQIEVRPIKARELVESKYALQGLNLHTSSESPQDAWDKFNTFMRTQGELANAVKNGHANEVIVSGVSPETGKLEEHGRLIKSPSEYDPNTNMFLEPPSKEKIDTSRAWRIVLKKDSPLRKVFKKGTELYAPTATAGSNFVSYLNNVLKRMRHQVRMGIDPAQSVQTSLNAGNSLLQVMKNGQVPLKIGKTGRGNMRRRLWANDWGSDENRMGAMKEFADEYGHVMFSINNPKLAGYNLDDLTVDPLSNPMVGAITDFVDYWHPDIAKHEIESELKLRVNSRAKTLWLRNMEAEGTTAAASAQEAADAIVNGITSGEVPEGVEFASEEEKQLSSLSPQDRAMKQLSSLGDRADAFVSSETDDLLQKIGAAFKDTLKEAEASASAGNYDEVGSKIQNFENFARKIVMDNSGEDAGDKVSRLNEHLFPARKSLESVLLMAKAVKCVADEESFEKANFTYSHKEGNELYPKYMYTDEGGNMSTRSNAPQGHPDYDSAFGEAEDDQMSPENAPQFFTQDGRKMSRAPYTGADVQWNSNYHRNDPQNLWAARWVNPVSGEHEYSYVDSDLRSNQQFQINRQNALTDNRLPHFRQYVAALFKSTHQKDRIVAVILALLDQGRFRVRELMALRVRDVRLTREVLTIGRRKVYGGPNLVQQLGAMVSNRHPDEPLFMVAPVGMDGDMDYSKMRRIGPHFVVNLLEEIGITAESLQTYHASQTYSMEIQRLFGEYNVSYGAAHHFALLEVASEMGHDLGKVEDFESAIYAIESAAIDPIVVQAIKQTCDNMGIGSKGDPQFSRPVHDSIPMVSLVLTGRTEDEEEFSRWLRTVPVHNFPGKAAA